VVERDEEGGCEGWRGGEEGCGLKEYCDCGCLVGWAGSCEGKEGEECG
jgi:hypothetical protein